MQDRFSRWMLETELEHLIKQAKQGKEAARAWHKECLHIYTSLLEEDAAKPGMLSPSDFQLRVVAAQHKLQACVVSFAFFPSAAFCVLHRALSCAIRLSRTVLL